MERKKIVDRKEMIEVLEHCIKEQYSCDECPRAYKDGRATCDDYRNGLTSSIPADVIQDVIDMLEPVSPIERSDPKGNARYLVCGSCGMYISELNNFCRNCGKMVKRRCDEVKRND